MFTYIYEWLEKISVYLILMTAVQHVLPSDVYKKYIRFFIGIVLIMMLLMPVLNVGKAEWEIPQIDEKYESAQEEMQEKIQVEDIVIGH